MKQSIDSSGLDPNLVSLSSNSLKESEAKQRYIGKKGEYKKLSEPQMVVMMSGESKPANQGRWRKDEHCRFLEALKLYGKSWKKVQAHVTTRTSTQARSHAQKFFVKLEKK